MNHAKLDTLYQQTLLAENPISILGGKAEVIHHFKPKSQGLSVRWYKPNGISLTNDQHQEIHGKNRAKLEKAIIEKLGDKWIKDVRIQSTRIVKYPNEEAIINHIKGEIKNYI